MLPPSAQRLIEFSGFSKHVKQVVHFPHIPTGQVLIERKGPVKLSGEANNTSCQRFVAHAKICKIPL
jgi:hypothetical protein